jgi:HSP20 family protein
MLSLLRKTPLDLFFDDLFSPIRTNSLFGNSTGLMEEVVEDETSYKIRMEVPGYSSEEVNIEMNESSISISGKKEKKEESKTSFRSESSSFSRTFSLPSNCATDKVEATHENGVLLLTLPKTTKEVSKSKQIPIKTGKE